MGSPVSSLLSMYPRQALQRPPTGTDRKRSKESLFSTAKGLGKGWPKDRKPSWQYLP